jgi:tyrosine-specific transport protein
MKSKVNVFSGALLVAGTAIGAGMLALPIATCLAGFVPAILIFFICWLFMAATGLLFLEICLWLPEDANIISMSTHLLGPAGKLVSWSLYLFLFYCLMIAYTSGGGGFINDVMQGVFGVHAPRWMSLLLFALLFAPIVHLGARQVDKVNSLFMFGLIAAYIGFVMLGLKNVDSSNLSQGNAWQGILALPIVFTSFSYQGIVPSLVSYMRRNISQVRASIWIGTAIPLIIYVIWQYLILGIIPIEGKNGLLEAKQQGLSAIAPLHSLIASPWISSLGQAFGFFALTTSFMGVGLGLTDFLADGLRIPKRGLSKWALTLAVFIPPLFIAEANPKIFLSALDYAGGIGCALLLGLLPVVMVWIGRYKKGYRSHVQLPGGRALLLLLALFILFELFIELAHFRY